MGTECRYGVMTAMALPSAARRRAMWCRRPRGPRLPPHRLVLPSAGSSSLLSCTRSIRRRCSPGAFAGGHLPELLLLASTRSWCRHLPRPLPRASGSAPQSGSAAPGLPPPRHSGSAAPRLPPPRHSGSAAPRLPPPRHSGSASSQDQQAPRFIFDDMPEPYFSDSELRVSSGEEEETFDVCLNIDDITVEDERIPCWSPHDSDYSRSDSAKSDSLSSEDLKAIAKEQVRELIKKVDMKKREEKEERKRERDKRKEKEEERKRERRKGREERKKKERKREREKRKEKIEEEREEEDRKRKKRKGKEEEERKRKGKREKRKREEETKMEKRRHKGGR